MNTRERADLFVRYVGLELKGRIVSQGFTAQQVAFSMGRSPAAFNRWLNGKSDIPLAVTCEACEVIGIEPTAVVSAAYDRMAVELGELDGTTYDEDSAASRLATVHTFSRPADDVDGMITSNPAASDPDEGYDPDAEVEAQQDQP